MQFDCLNRYRPLGLIFNGTGGTPGDGGSGNEGGSSGGNGGDAGAGGNNSGGGDLGFPANTPWRDMQPAEQTAYWRHQAQKHERTAESRKDYDQLKTDSAELARLKAENATDAEKALDEARRQGENLGAEKYVKTAVEGHLRGETGKTADEIKAALKFVDVSTFLDDKGDLDPALIKEFAEQLATSKPANDDGQQQQRRGVLRQELSRGGSAQPRTSGSLKERAAARRAELTKSTQS